MNESRKGEGRNIEGGKCGVEGRVCVESVFGDHVMRNLNAVQWVLIEFGCN